MKKLYSIFSGFLIGIGAVLPGVSGSVIAIILGEYERVIKIFNDKSKNLYVKFKELFTLGLGLCLGVIVSGNILFLIYYKYEVQMKYIFMGLILGSIPLLNNEIKKRENDTINYLYFLVAFLISSLFFILSNLYIDNILNNNSIFKLFIAGFLYSSGKIIPGLSSSFFMIVLGLYEYILKFISNPFLVTINQIVTAFPFILGVMFGILILFKLINFFLNRYFTKTYSSIIGFVLGSILSIYPGFEFEFKYYLSIIFMIFSFLFIIIFNKKEH